MPDTSSTPARGRLVTLWRLGWTVGTACVVQGLICGLALLPVVWLWTRLATARAWGTPAFLAVAGFAVVPSYVLFALALMIVSPLAMRLAGWRTPESVEMTLTGLDWPLLDWVRTMIGTHLVRFLAGSLFRGTPIWTAYLRLAGARLGRRVYINSLAMSDYNLLDFGDDVVIGEDVHISGHTVEGGVVRTGRVRLGPKVTIGLGSVIGIDVEVGAGCQVGALSLVPKRTTLEPGATYAGIPVRRLDTDAVSSMRPE